jgi:two-component sensor histidine kinase/CheY-like chemotaxis protein
MNKQNSKNILLVEDEALIAMAEKRQLEGAGYRVVHCPTGERAIDLVVAQRERFDLILMDINLGKGMDGTEAAREILRCLQIPILFLSSHTEKEIVEKTEAITNYGYVVKNSTFTVLDASIKMAFKLFDANEETRVINDNLVRSENELIRSEAAIRNKLKAILEPDGDLGSLALADIIDYQSIQSLMEDFYKLTGILGAILDIKGNILVAAGWQDICTKFHRCNPVTARHCKKSDTQLTSGVAEGTYKLYRCKNNMWDMVTPLMVDGHHVGNIFIGQFLFADEEPDLELYRRQAKEYGFDEAEYLAALSRVPRFSKAMVDTGMDFYSKVARMISSLSYSSIKLSRTIAERKEAEDAVRRLLAEKELILKEVHHRVKNNLGIVNSLLAMQSQNQANPEVKNILYDASSRIESMRLLYDKLYQSEGFKEINLRDYVSLLATEIVDIFPQRSRIDLSVDIDDVQLDAKTASSLGIIVNELITNSMKYAFAGRDSGRISIQARAADGRIRFSYEDDGVGIPERISFEHSTGFGMQLMKMLAEEMDGTMRIDRGAAHRFVLEFGIPEKEKERI